MSDNEGVNAQAEMLLEGGYDLHVHASPCVFPRVVDCVELIREASMARMAGVMLKSHYESTGLLAEIVNKYSKETTRAYGGIALNWPVGGLNVYAVENAMKAGAKIVWMPTRDSKNSLCFGNMDGDFFSRPGITILKDNDLLKDEVYNIMDVIKEHNRFLATGHLSPRESFLLCREGCKRGVNMILTHPEFPRTTISGNVQREIADMGAIIEKNWFNIAQKAVTVEQMAANIRQVGVGRVYIATDRGQRGAPHPTAELKSFIVALLQQGFTDNEIKSLVQSVPKSIVE